MTDWAHASTWLYTWASERLPLLLDLSIRLAFILVLACVLRFVARRAIRLIHATLRNRTDSIEDIKRIDTLVRVARYAASVVIFILAGGLALSVLGISVAPLLATAGVAGIAIGFGAQTLVKDLFSGFFVLLENQIRVGDVVSIAGRDGAVEEVTLRYVRLRDYAGDVHFVPNGEITVVTSRSREFAHAVLDVGVHYRDDVDDMFALMTAVAAEMREDKDYALKILDDLEIAGVQDWNASAVTLRARIKTLPLAQWEVRREFLRRLKARFDAAGHEIPYPQVTLSLARETEAVLTDHAARLLTPDPAG
ncbi:MAG: mechanosensitive ion channel family protein [Methyloversatilis discipulorum]|uniref:mechanosensitive ion channel family protein n=1 Tax=Methyloversatilis discipulorum TaxID=1119528 RepID=UPI0026F1F429|nr:mechanosensitive ion channel family protein [Methyloversatilis discipulorum]MBV5287233.1 mechanosensitive ion channel family protein [Methyloversatilis discipulorum]